MAQPDLDGLRPLLDAMRAWANGALTAYKECANRPVAVWDLSLDTQGALVCANNLPSDRVIPEGAHVRLAIAAAMQAFGDQLVAVAARGGWIGIGLQTLRVAICPSSQPFKHLVSLSHSGVLLWPTEKAMGTEKALAYMGDALELLAQVPMDASAPRRLYDVEAYRVAAPEPRAAVALHLVQHDQARLHRVLSGVLDTRTRLRVSEILTDRGEQLLVPLKG